MSEKELEERVMIDKKQFLEIEKYFQENFPNYRIIHQKNHYFDDKYRTIKKLDTVLRIRSFKDKKEREFTYKIKGEEGDIEYTQLLSRYWFYQITRYSKLPDGPVKQKLFDDKVDIESLKMLVDLYTRRMEVRFDNYLFVLDANMYNGITDYNIEIESDISKQHAKEVILQYCNQFGLEYKKKYIGKCKRALQSIKNNG